MLLTDTAQGESADGTPNYAQLSVELHNAQWFIFFNGDLLGNVKASRESNGGILEFVTRGGTAIFEAPSVYRLVEKPSVPE